MHLEFFYLSIFHVKKCRCVHRNKKLIYFNMFTFLLLSSIIIIVICFIYYCHILYVCLCIIFLGLGCLLIVGLGKKVKEAGKKEAASTSKKAAGKISLSFFFCHYREPGKWLGLVTRRSLCCNM